MLAAKIVPIALSRQNGSCLPSLDVHSTLDLILDPASGEATDRTTVA